MNNSSIDLSTAEIYAMLIDEDFFTEEELDLVTGINGFNFETLNDCCRYRYSEDVVDLLKLDEEDYEEDEEDYEEEEEE